MPTLHIREARDTLFLFIRYLWESTGVVDVAKRIKSREWTEWVKLILELTWTFHNSSNNNTISRFPIFSKNFPLLVCVHFVPTHIKRTSSTRERDKLCIIIIIIIAIIRMEEAQGKDVITTTWVFPWLSDWLTQKLNHGEIMVFPYSFPQATSTIHTWKRERLRERVRSSYASVVMCIP